MKSFILVSVFGSYIEDFMSELIEKSIRVRNVQNRDGIIYFETSPRNYKIIARLAFTLQMRTRVEARRGAYFKLRRYRKRYGILFGAVSFLLIITLMSNFVWDIRVSGNENVSDVQVLEILEKHGIRSGTYIKGYDKTGAELAAELELDSLAWISIERDGSRINVKVSERLENHPPEIPITTPCNVIATKSGQNVETEVYRGTLLFEKGSGINRGDVIVSGVVVDGAGNVIFSHADAKIIAEVVEEEEFFEPFVSLERKRNGKVTKNDFIIFLGKSFPLFINDASHEQAVYSEELRAPTFFGLKLPWRVKTGVYTHYDVVEVEHTRIQTLDRLKKQIENYRENFFADSEIILFDEEYFPEDDGIAVKVRIIYRTDIAQKKIIGIP